MKSHDLDFGRQERTGIPEFVFGESKTVPQLVEILEAYAVQKTSCLVTRLQPEKGEGLLGRFPSGCYEIVAGTFRLGPNADLRKIGQVAVISAGTSDVPVVAEVSAVLSFLGIEHCTLVDKGVAGIHRLHDVMPELEKADVIICVAGFEGALPSVLSGLIGQPIIGVPTSVGYGVARGGVAALHAMLASCGSGVTVVNIDNGFGAAIAAARILGPESSNL